MVEFAMVAPLLFVLIFGIIDFGRALFLMNNITSAVREGARMAAVQLDPTSATSKAAVQQRVKDYITNFGGSPPPTNPTVTVTTDASGRPVSVKVTLTGYPFVAITPLVPITQLIKPGGSTWQITMPQVSAVFRSEVATNP